MNPNSTTLTRIVDTVAGFYNLTRREIESRTRVRRLAYARQVCMYLARRHTRYSLADIGYLVAGRDAATVFYGVRAVEARMKEDRGVAAQVGYLELLLARAA